MGGSIVILCWKLKSSIVDGVVVGEDGGSRSWILLNEDKSWIDGSIVVESLRVKASWFCFGLLSLEERWGEARIFVWHQWKCINWAAQKNSIRVWVPLRAKYIVTQIILQIVNNRKVAVQLVIKGWDSRWLGTREKWKKRALGWCRRRKSVIDGSDRAASDVELVRVGAA